MYALCWLITLLLTSLGLNADNETPVRIEEPYLPAGVVVEVVNPPGGLSNRGNTCYLASALQLFAQGYNGHLSGEDPVLLYLIPVLADLTAGESFGEMGEVATVLFNAHVSDVPVGEMGCALEVFEQLVNRLEGPSIVTHAQVLPLGEERVIAAADPAGDMPGADEIYRMIEDRMLILPVVDVEGVVSSNLNLCLRHLLSTEQEKVRFQRDGNLVEAAQGIQEGRLDVSTLPDILPIGLRRQTFVAGAAVKIEADIAVDDIWLMPKECLSKEETTVAYQLIGFIRHSGNASGGHYTAYVLRGDTWYCADDSNVYAVALDAAHAQARQALVLLFKRPSGRRFLYD